MSAFRAFLVLTALMRGIAAAADAVDDPWAEILAARVERNGEVAYRSLKQNDGVRFEDVLHRLAAARPEKLERDGAVAFWLNAYHAMVVAAVLRGESPETVASRARMYHWFGEKVGGARRTLDDVRAILDAYASADPRIHLAVSNGTRGGPALAAEPYTAGRLDSQLAAAARRFVNDPERYRADSASGRIELSRIFAWYRSDFDHEAGSVEEFLRPLATRDDLLEVLGVPELKVRYRPFDWRLNAQPGERPK
jgi:Protein of unknown function, DUF547